MTGGQQSIAALFRPQRRHPGWMDRALCTEVDPELFFPEKQNREAFTAALEICAKCPVRRECKDYGRDEKWGVWGGVPHIYTWHHNDAR